MDFLKGYIRLNCGRGSSDNKKNIRKNLNIVAKKLKLKSNKLIVHRTHSNKVVRRNDKNLKSKINADAIITKKKESL